jgi:hypothetical protein
MTKQRRTLPKAYILHIVKIVKQQIVDFLTAFFFLDKISFSAFTDEPTNPDSPLASNSLSSPFAVIHQSGKNLVLSNDHMNITDLLPPGQVVRIFDDTDKSVFAKVVSSSWSIYNSFNHTHVEVDTAMDFTAAHIRLLTSVTLPVKDYLLRDGSVLMYLPGTFYNSSPYLDANYVFLDASLGNVTADFPAGSLVRLTGNSASGKILHLSLLVTSASWEFFMSGWFTKLTFNQTISPPITYAQHIYKYTPFVPSHEQHIATKKYVDDAITAALSP